MQTKAIATIVAVTLAGTLGACKRRQAVNPVPPDWLEGVVVEQAQQGGADAEQIGNIYKGIAYREDEKSQWQIPLELGKCYWFSIAGDEHVQETYINVFDPNDSRVAKQKQGGPKNLLAYCNELPGMYKVEVKVTEGYGHYHMGVFAKDAPKAGPAAPKPEQPKGPDLGEIIAKLAESAAPGAERIGELFEGEADKTDWYVQLETGKCYWLIGAGEDTVKELYLYLWDPKDKRITANKAENGRVTVGHCAEIGGMYHFQAKVNSGEGKYKIGVYAKAKAK